MEPLTLPACAVLLLMLITVHVLWLALRSWKLQSDDEHRNASPPLPPGPVRLPVIGSAHFFVLGSPRHGLHRALARLAQTYGPVASFRPGTAADVVVVSSPAAAQEALAENDAALSARWVPDATRALDHSAASVFLLPTSNPLWKQHRITVSAHLSSGRGLAATRHVRERQARRLAEHLGACSGQVVTVGPTVMNTVLNAVSNTLFSKDVVDVQGRHAAAFKDLVDAVNKESVKPNLSDAFPFLAPLDLFGIRRTVTRNLAALYKFVDEEFIESRLASGENHHGDLLDIILAQHAKSQLTRSEVTQFCIEIFVGSSETTTATVHWAMAHLLRQPEKMEKVCAELTEHLGSKNFVEESDLDKLPYLLAVMKETLRMYPPVPIVPRQVVTDGVSLAGFSIPVGTRVFVNLWAIGRDPMVWPEPEEFKPERFLGNQQTVNFRSSNFAYRPFGAGRKMCPGIDLASRFVPLLLASILHNLQWRLPDGMLPEDLDLREHHGTVLDLATPLRGVPVCTM